MLGVMYENGEGVPQDYVQAHMWLNLSASSALPAAGTDPFARLMRAATKQNREGSAKIRDSIAAKIINLRLPRRRNWRVNGSPSQNGRPYLMAWGVRGSALSRTADLKFGPRPPSRAIRALPASEAGQKRDPPLPPSLVADTWQNEEGSRMEFP